MSTMPKKGSRTITVRNRTFRWLLKGYARFWGNTWTKPTLTVQAEEETPGRVMQCVMVYAPTKGREPDPDEGEPYVNTAVLPSHVKVVIEAALDAGWDPDERGVPFKLPERGFGGEGEESYRTSDPEFIGEFPDR